MVHTMIKNGWESVKVCEECGSPFNPPEQYPGEDTCEICWSLRGLPLPAKRTLLGRCETLIVWLFAVGFCISCFLLLLHWIES
jgi:hypothetical protein